MADYQLLRKLNLKNPWHLLAVGLGSGLSPKAPGTCGSFLAMFFCMALLMAPWYVTPLVAIVVFFIGVKACNEAEKAMGTHDHGGLVIDEFVGMFISIIAFPQGAWYLAILAFALFRFFDILKPFPVSYADRNIKGGLGVMVDDVLAGIYALLSGHIILYFLPL
ncbi:MAG TPA: phosphatidylglycerophosphatase A [Candidatus Anaerobiospirillum pullistercoris]|uniref:Phosphatidylglycerophosphatase A n=1 Tax=Candidatus Anaerobiospirillum pullistercoris TaxID=2838452 RepID=A0A9D2B0W1_9GAMM|nr:phosphatidylglycerophosphatase A [Candidatus Anaerobiospirillum pullistercoris]